MEMMIVEGKGTFEGKCGASIVTNGILCMKGGKVTLPKLLWDFLLYIKQETCAIAKMSVRCPIRQYAHDLLLESLRRICTI